MKKQKDISTLFREGSEKLSVQPSPQAWNKLERKLEARPGRGRLVPLRWLSIAAALLVLVAAVYFFGNNNAPVNGDWATPEFIEVLKGGEDCNPYCALLEARKQLPEDYARPARWEN